MNCRRTLPVLLFALVVPQRRERGSQQGTPAADGRDPDAAGADSSSYRGCSGALQDTLKTFTQQARRPVGRARGRRWPTRRWRRRTSATTCASCARRRTRPTSGSRRCRRSSRCCGRRSRRSRRRRRRRRAGRQPIRWAARRRDAAGGRHVPGSARGLGAADVRDELRRLQRRPATTWRSRGSRDSSRRFRGTRWPRRRSYNIGMSYFSQSKWPEARDAFLKVINDYPQAQGSAVPDAYFKLGQTYERLNQIDNAKKAYETAVQKFPGPPSAMSSQALARLNARR